MITTRLLLGTIALASFGTACTAIVIGKVSDTSDYETVPVGGSTKSTLDQCSLRKGSFGEADANPCSDCIETNCKPAVDFACNGGTQEKPWFDQMKSCAQDPFVTPGQGFDNNDCKRYADAKAPIADNGSDTQREIEAHNCITSSCLQSATPACKQCEVSIVKSQAESTPVRLQDDACGRCLVANCQAQIVQCCTTLPIKSFVEKCAFTAKPENKAACLELGNAVPDGGEGESNYRDGSANLTCRDLIAQCFQANCKDKGGCTP